MEYQVNFGSFQGWQAYAKWADSYKLINGFINIIN